MTRTKVWIRTQDNASTDEARRALTQLASEERLRFAPLETNRPNKPGSTTPGGPMNFTLSCEGDVRQAVVERLAELSDLPFNVEVEE